MVKGAEQPCITIPNDRGQGDPEVILNPPFHHSVIPDPFRGPLPFLHIRTLKKFNSLVRVRLLRARSKMLKSRKDLLTVFQKY